MGEVSQLVTDVKVEGNFDVTDAQALRWLTRRHRKMVVRSRCFRKVESIGVTVIGETNYLIAADVVDITEVVVGDAAYGKMRHVDITNGASGFLILSGDGGVFAGTEGSDGLEYISLFPAPADADVDIWVRGAFRPPDLDVSDDTTLKIPNDFCDELVAGAIATGLQRVEQRPDLAAGYESEFASGCEELRRQVLKRYRGTGPAMAKIQGFDA